MRIFSKQALRFGDPNKEQPSVHVKALAFADVPGWVGELPFFKLAKSDGTITVSETPKEVKAVEKVAADNENIKAANLRKATKVSPTIVPDIVTEETVSTTTPDIVTEEVVPKAGE